MMDLERFMSYYPFVLWHYAFVVPTALYLLTLGARPA